MPWTAKDAPQHTHYARTPHLKEVWAKAANASRDRLLTAGRSVEDADRHAIRIANAAVDKAIGRKPDGA